MNTTKRGARWVPVWVGSLLLLAGAARADVYLDGNVTLDYYVAQIDDEGFEFADAEFYAERVINDSAAASGPLSLSGWLSPDASAAGVGTEVGYLPFGAIPGSSSTGPVTDVVPAEDAVPGEYFPYVLLQDDRFPDSFEDARSLSPRLLWRGGLEAVGPLYIIPYAGGQEVTVDFDTLRNNRVDSRVSNPIVLTLYATFGYGPASDGYVLCRRTVGGLYAGDRRDASDFDCTLAPIPDGEYTLHLEVAEDGGRGGASTLSGPDIRFRGGRIDDGYPDTVDVYVGASDTTLLVVLLAALLLQLARRRAWLTMERINAA